MTKTEQAAFNAVVRLMKHYRNIAEANTPGPMTEERVKEILALPSAELVNMCVAMANLREEEEQVINYCYRLGYTQEKTAEKMLKSRNTVYTLCHSGLEKLIRAWDGVFWIKSL